MGRYNNDPQRNKRKVAARHPYRPSLKMRAMAGQTAWLKGQLHWVGGRVGWENGSRLLVPRVSDIALAQRRLGQIERLNRHTPGVGQQWLTDRRAHLQLAKQLQPLYEPDLATLITARPGDPTRWQRLAALLPVEMLCREPLPLSPAQALLTSGWAALSTLQALADNTEQPLEGRALAALLIGAIQQADPACDQRRPQWPDPWQQRAYQWGRQAGFPAHHRLITLMLAQSDGLVLARRCLEALAANVFCQLPAETYREFLLEGTPAREVAALAEAAVVISPMFHNSHSARLDTRLSRSLSIPTPYQYDLYRYEHLPKNELKAWLHQYMRNVRQSAVVDYFGQILQFLLNLWGYEDQITPKFLQPLANGLKLPPAQQLDYFQLLVEERDYIWDIEEYEERPFFSGWLDQRIERTDYLQRLLRTTNDPAVVRQIIRQKAVNELRCAFWPEIDYYRLFLRLNQQFNPSHLSETAENLARLLGRFPNAKAAQTAFSPLFAIAGTIEPPHRRLLLNAVLEHSPLKYQEARPWLVAQSRYLPFLLKFINNTPKRHYLVNALVTMIFEIDQRFETTEALDRADLVLKRLAQIIKEERKKVYHTNHLHLKLAWLVEVAGDDPKTLLNGLEAIIQVNYEFQDETYFQAGRQLLKKFPLLQKALGLALPLNHDRCIKLIERLGQAAELGELILGPLDRLHFQEEVPPDPRWQALLSFAPTEGYTVKQYRLARRLTGQSDELPGSLLKILAGQTRLATELAHLETRLADQPDQPHLTARLNSLRERLTDQARLDETIGTEVAKKLPLAWATALLEAAEQQVRECFRLRLNYLVRGLPPDLPMSDDLLNAVLLTNDIRHNQRWLLKLLRSWLRGERDWRENLAANQAFLKQLTEEWHGRAESWLAENPKTYDVPQLGGPVLLRLENNPLHVLQMGNYFDTCLSLGGFNAFSTVTNAIELNKRVIYATDRQGKVIGRKLIAITDKGKLVGYRNYTGLNNVKSNRALRYLLNGYSQELAGQVGLELADDGIVPQLLADKWYDDGTEDWLEAEVEKSVDKVVDKLRIKSIDKTA